jgi:hypothetical protein
MAFRGIVWECGQVVLTDLDSDGFPIAQPDGLGGDPRIEPYRLIHQFGFSSRPRDPDVGPDGAPVQGGGCTALIGIDGHDKYLLPLDDPRAIDLRPDSGAGGSVQYAHRLDGLQSYAHFDPDGNLRILVQYTGGEHEITANVGDDHIKINGAKVTKTGNVITANGVDVDNHVHPTAMGPSQAPTPSPPI